jgi:D-arginine dehydrogenase
MTDSTTAFIVIGAGMAGASCAFELAAHGRVIVLEQERQPGFHATGRSAALYATLYGKAVVRALSVASRPFFDALPGGFWHAPALSRRGTLFPAHEDRLSALDEIAGDSVGLSRIGRDEILRMVPILRPEFAAAGLYEPQASDIDVDTLLQGYLRGLRARGGTLVTDAEMESAVFRDGSWQIETSAGAYTAPIIVNAAGAWADIVAQRAGLGPLGLQPLRRTAILTEAPPFADFAQWPCVIDASEQFYFKPDAGRLLVSPADETPTPPVDAQPEELDVAIAVDRFETATTMTIRRPSHRWAGLRTFSPDRSPVIGFDPRATGFFWLAGQGGYGIQTAPAASQLAAALVTGTSIADHLCGIDRNALSPTRFTQP